MLGTIVNTIAIIIGSILGILLKDRFNKALQHIVQQATGLSVLMLGICTAVTNMQSELANSTLFVISLVIGGIIGEVIDIEAKLDSLGKKIENKVGSGTNTVAKSFVNASLLFCVGSMAILGSMESGLQHIHTTLFIKSILDGVMSVVIAASMGIGVFFAAISVFLYQGALTLLAGFIAPYITEPMLCEISITGGILIAGIGINLLEIKTIKVGNLLPAIFVPVVYYLIVGLL